MNSWTLSLHWSCLCSRCYHPYVRSAPSRQCPPINAFAAILGFKLSWPKTKLQNVGAGDPPWTILIYGVQVEGVEEFIYLIGSQQSSNGYCRPDIRRRIKLACSVMNSLESMELQFSQYQHQSTPVPSTDKVCSAQRYRNIDHLGRRHEYTGGFPREVSATDNWCMLVGSCLQCRGASGDLVCQPLVTSYIIDAYLCLAVLHAWTLEYQYMMLRVRWWIPTKAERQWQAGEDRWVALATSGSTKFRRMPTLYCYLRCGDLRSPWVTVRRDGHSNYATFIDSLKLKLY